MTHAQKVNRFMYAYTHPGCDCCCVIAELLDEEWQRVYKESLEPSQRLAYRARIINKWTAGPDEELLLHPVAAQPFFEFLYNGLYI